MSRRSVNHVVIGCDVASVAAGQSSRTEGVLASISALGPNHADNQRLSNTDSARPVWLRTPKVTYHRSDPRSEEPRVLPGAPAGAVKRAPDVPFCRLGGHELETFGVRLMARGRPWRQVRRCRGFHAINPEGPTSSP
jgi:hypothetical protein